MKKTYKPKPCELCGNMFFPLSGTAKYCFSCQRKVVLARNRARYAAMSDEERAKHNESKRKSREIKYAWCKTCGKKFVRTGNKTHCSEECTKLDYGRMERLYHKRTYIPVSPHEIICKKCGQPFMGVSNVKYCFDCCPKRAYESRTRNLMGAIDNVPV